MARTLLLDNEPVQALLEPRHPKHRRVLAHLEVSASRNRRRAGSMSVMVPTTVRVEAGWDRQAPAAATANRMPIADAILDAASANRAAHLRNALGISPADAHLGSVLQDVEGDVTVLTSDPADLRRIVQETGRPATVVAV